MVHFKTLILHLLVLFTLIIGSCKRGDESTEVPKEYFECLINGKRWSYSQCIACTDDALLTEYYGMAQLRIRASQNEYPQTVISFFLNNSDLHSGDTIHLSAGSQSSAEVYRPFEVSSGKIAFTTSNIATGRIVVSRNDNDLIQGTFQFDAVNSDSLTIHLTDGKFSINK